ncbi:MAG: DUF4224 domain-containing protein [Janthinobacterium lividum]
MNETGMFLTEAEVDELTGISRGRTEILGKRKVKREKFDLQATHLRHSGLPFYTNVRGRPIVARISIEGRAGSIEPVKPAWQPPVLVRR